MSQKDGGPAFPVEEIEGPAEARHRWVLSYGMSLRDYFAGQALAGMLSSEECGPSERSWGRPLDIAKAAYDFADAMLQAREGS